MRQRYERCRSSLRDRFCGSSFIKAKKFGFPGSLVCAFFAHSTSRDYYKKEIRYSSVLCIVGRSTQPHVASLSKRLFVHQHAASLDPTTPFTLEEPSYNKNKDRHSQTQSSY